VTLLCNKDGCIKTDTGCTYADQHSVDMSRSLSSGLCRFGNNNILKIDRHLWLHFFFHVYGLSKLINLHKCHAKQVSIFNGNRSTF